LGFKKGVQNPDSAILKGARFYLSDQASMRKENRFALKLNKQSAYHWSV